MCSLIFKQEQVHIDSFSVAGACDSFQVQHNFEGIRVIGVILGRADKFSLGIVGEADEAKFPGCALQHPNAPDANQRAETPVDLSQLLTEDPSSQDYMH
jgi:hypothetical protein